MEKLFTVGDVAKKLKCNRSTVTRIADRLKFKTKVANVLVFTAEEVAAIKAASQGRRGSPGGKIAEDAGRKGGTRAAAAKKARRKKGQ